MFIKEKQLLVEQKNIVNNKLSLLSQNFIKTLAYYDIFNYPLTREEIFYNSFTNGDSKETVFDEIDNLVDLGIIYHHNGYYLLYNNGQYVPRRITGNKRAERKLKIAKCFSNIIAKFPYVRAVLVSGSLSKGYMDEDADIDFFVITEPNRLWISRFLLMVFKKIFLLNSKKNFCINYYITTDNLEIEDKNIFIAIEFASLLPTYGSDIYDKLYSSNQWIKNYVPNYPVRETKDIKKFRPCLLQKIIEPLLANKLGCNLDDFFMNLFYKYDKKRYSDYDEKSFASSFKIRKNISTHHPDSFQNKVLHALEQKILHLQGEHNILLN